MQIFVSIGTVGGGLLPKQAKYYGFVTSLTLLPFYTSLQLGHMSNCAEVEPLDRFSRFLAQPTCFRARRCLWGLERWVTYLGKYARNLKTWEGIGNIEPKCRNIKVAISQKLQVRSRVDLRIKLRPTMDFVADLTLLSSNPIWLPTAILKNGCDVITPPSVDQF